MIVINFDYRRRIVLNAEEASKKYVNNDPDILRQFRPEGFSSWLRKHDLLPPDLDQPEYDEKEIAKEHEEANSDAARHVTDHKDDMTSFEICLINKDDSGLFIGAFVRQSEVNFVKIITVEKNALIMANTHPLRRE